MKIIQKKANELLQFDILLYLKSFIWALLISLAFVANKSYSWDQCSAYPNANSSSLNTPEATCAIYGAGDFKPTNIRPTFTGTGGPGIAFDCRNGPTPYQAFGGCYNVGKCPTGYYPDAITGHCNPGTPKDKGDPCPSGCGAGNPIHAGWGNKFQREVDYRLPSSHSERLSLTRYYNKMGSVGPTSSASVPLPWGENWTNKYTRALQSVNGVTTIWMPDGRSFDFIYNSTAAIWQPDADIASSLVFLSDGTIKFINAETDEVEIYDESSLVLKSITARDGYTERLTYSNSSTNQRFVLDASGNPTSTVLPSGFLIQITDSFNRTLSFGYDANYHIIRATDPSGGVYQYAYDASNTAISGNLNSVTYPDGKTRTYVYNEAANVSGTSLSNAFALTGIIDENNQRFATWKYDSFGRAISSEHDVVVGSTIIPVEKVSIAYHADANGNVSSSDVTDALNTTRIYGFTNVLGVVKNTGITQPCNSGCGTASATMYDANGNISSKTDFNGSTMCYQYDLTRNLETVRVEGLGAGKSCPSDLMSYTPAANTVERKIATTWHPTYRLPATITEAGKITTLGYDASGNLLSKTITDTALNKSRTWTYTYNTLGQVLTADGPRTDVNDVTTYTYYSAASNTAGSVHSIGDLATVTNAAGLVTSITNYDLNGRPLSITDPNGVVTTLTYWPRGWLKTRTVNGAQTTQYAYDGVGQLTQVTLPDNSALKYTYDTAHRLTDIEDGSVSGGVLVLTGNKIHYTLDAMGNRLSEATYDPGSTLTRAQIRVFDALNRLQRSIGGGNPYTEITQYSYDNNGNLKTITDPLNHITSNGYDALNRLITVTDPANGVSTTNYNALDQVASVVDPRFVTTSYTINALGDVTLTQSPDSGNTNNVYDAAGNVTQKTDARGVVSNYTYDALNRLTSITYPANASENVAFTYGDTSTTYYRKGRLSNLRTTGSIVSFTYDAYGNVTQQIDFTPVMWGISQYLYDNANRVQQITYPSGRIVTYTRNALGQITQVQTQDNASAAAQTIISSAGYEPFGPLKSLTFNNGVNTTIQHDADYRVGRITTTSVPGWDYVYSYDSASNLTGMADQIGGANKGYAYDALNRVITDNNADNTNFSYQYDAGGNLTQISLSGLFNVTQQYEANSNRLIKRGNTAIGSDLAGNLTSRAATASMSYNNANRLLQSTANASTTQYQYTGLGQRDGKTGTTILHYDYLPDGKYLSQTQLNADNTYNQAVDYIWLDDVPVAQVKTTYNSDGSVNAQRLTYIHADHLNTPRLMTDSTKTVVWKWSGNAYGGIIEPNANPDGDSITDTLDLRFPGQIADSETGLFYNMNRYYDPVTGRYTQSDPIGLKGGLNTYEYALDNPLRYTDPLGLSVDPFCDDNLRTCRLGCGKRPLLSGPCLIKCEEKYGALSECQPPPPPPPEQCPPEKKKDPAPDPLTPECTFERWKVGQC